MAIWPFGRRGKRPRSQMKASDAADRRLSLEDGADRPPTLAARKPSRKRSKRDKHRTAGPQTPAADVPRVPVPAPAPAPARPVPFAYKLDNHTSLSSIGQDHFTVARPTPILQRRSDSAATTKGATLKKRMSKRSARDIQREQEIKALSSSPPPNPPAAWGYLAFDVRRGPSVHIRHADQRASNQSLPIESRSSLSESSDYLYTYKVNALAVLAPRPVIRYSEHHNKHPPRSTNPSSNSMRNMADEHDWNSRKRVAELADDLDATALRELLERDRRRREKKLLQDQERKQLRLQRKLEHEVEVAQPADAEEGLGIADKGEEIKEDAAELRGRDKTPSPATSSMPRPPATQEQEPEEQSGSWLRGSSKETQNRFSDISAHVIGNIDDRSLRAGRSGHGINTPSEDEASRHRPPVTSTSSARMSSVAQESISDVSRTEMSEKRLSDTSSGRRMASWISFFRRPSLRKRNPPAPDVDAPPSEFSNTSRDSFMRAHPKRTMPIPIPAERSFRRTGTTAYRSQSKFVEHLGDYPISPPDSRMQSPTPTTPTTTTAAAPPPAVAEDAPAADELESDPSRRQSFTDGEEEYNYDHGRPMSWDDNSVMLSQSLASIDSEGSWMSGKFLRRISQQQQTSSNYTSWRNSTGRNTLRKYDETDENGEDSYLNELAEASAEEDSHSVSGERRASSSAMGLGPAANTEVVSDESSSRPSSRHHADGLETWHGGVLERKPTVVRRASARARVVSNEVVLGDYDMLDTSSMADDDAR